MTAALQMTHRLVYAPRRAGRIWQVLAVFANRPVGLTSTQAAESLLPPPGAYRVANEPAARRARRERLGIAAGTEAWGSRQQARKRLRSLVSRDIRKLTSYGHLTRAVGPRLDPAELALFREKGWEGFRRLTHVVEDGEIVGRVLEPSSLRGRFRRSIVEYLAEHPEGIEVGHLMRATHGYTNAGNEHGTWRAAMNELVESGTVIPGRARFVTALGLSMLEVT